MSRRAIAYAAWAVPAGVLGQFMLAGLSLFHDAQVWASHGIVGSALALPIGLVATATFVDRRAAGLRFRALLLVALYLAQLALIIAGQDIGSGVLHALHAFNAGLVLLASFDLAQHASCQALASEASGATRGISAVTTRPATRAGIQST